MMAGTDTTTAWTSASGWITMNPTVLSTVAGGLVIAWDRLATVTIVQTMVVVILLRMHTYPRLHPTRCRLFRLVRVLVALNLVRVAHDRIKKNQNKSALPQ